jgi:transcriptional regulator with XRE-family HTH domain
MIQGRRLALGWTQEDLAERMAASGDATIRQSDISRLERGKIGLPRHTRLHALAAALALPLGELLARSGGDGAVTAFAPTVLPTAAVLTAVPEPEMRDPLPMRRVRLTEPAVSTESVLAELLRLRAVIARAQVTRAHTRDVLARSRALHARATRLL